MLDIIKTRRSVRKFDLNKKIPYETLVDLCKYASCAPTAKGQDDKEYLIIDDQDLIMELSEISKGSQILKNSNTAIVILGKDVLDMPAPEMVPADLAAATENLLLAATAMKLGSCWIGVYPIDLRMLKATATLKLPDNVFVYSIIALGYPEGDDAFYERNKFNEVDLHHNKY